MLRHGGKRISQIKNCFWKKRTAFYAAGFLAVIFLLPRAAVYAQAANFGLQYATALGLPTTDIRVTIANIIRVFIGVLGIIAVVIVLYGGFLWMTAAGSEERVTKAKQTLTSGVIGLVIIVSAFAIVQFVIGRLQEAAFGGGVGCIGPGCSLVDDTRRCGGLSCDTLGSGILKEHYPSRGATDIPRDTFISVTFKEAIKPESVITDTNGNGAFGDAGDSLASTVKLVKFADLVGGGSESLDARIQATDAAKFVTAVGAAVTPDKKTFVFRPRDLLGSPTDKTVYVVKLAGGATGILKTDGSPAFPPDIDGGAGYIWDFEVSTKTDTTPPQITDILPSAAICDALGCPRNSLVQITFNEPVDPTTVSGAAEIVGGATTGALDGARSLLNLEVTFTVGQVKNYIAGDYIIGNGYRTVEFVTRDKCGTNSCGGDVFCLPGNKGIKVLVKAASLGAAPPKAVFPSDGVTDLAANSLDGNRDGRAVGPSSEYDLDGSIALNAGKGDSVSRTFQTSNEIDLTPPVITATSPVLNGGEVPLTAPVVITWSKLMSAASLSNENLKLTAAPPYPFWYYVGSVNATTTTGVFYTRSEVHHELFVPNQGTCKTGPQKDKPCSLNGDCGTGNVCQPTSSYIYSAGVTSGVKDLNQNCFFPGAGPAAAVGATCAATAALPYCCNGLPQTIKCAGLP